LETILAGGREKEL